MYKLYGAVKKAYPKLRTMATFSGFSHVPTDLPVDVWVNICANRSISPVPFCFDTWVACWCWPDQWYYYAESNSGHYPPASVTAWRAAGKEYWWCKPKLLRELNHLWLF